MFEDINTIKKFKKKVNKKPWYLIYLFVLIYLLIKRRWNTSEEEVYLTKTDIKNHKLLNTFIPENILLKTFDGISSNFKQIVQRKAILEKDSDYVDRVRKRLKKGDKLIAIIDSSTNEIISFVFIAINKIILEQVHKTVNIESITFGIYDVYTYPEYRKKGYYEVVLALVISHFLRKGYISFYLWIIPENQISVKAHSRLKINNVIKVYKERYRMGFRIRKEKSVNFLLEKLIYDK